MCVSGCSVLSAVSARWSLSGQRQGLGLCRGGVARAGPLWPVALHDPGEAVHRCAAGRRHRPDPSAARHHRDLLYCEQRVHEQSIKLSPHLILFLIAPLCSP